MTGIGSLLAASLSLSRISTGILAFVVMMELQALSGLDLYVFGAEPVGITFTTEQVGEIYSWIRNEKIKAAYFGSRLGLEHARQLKEAGFNTILVKFIDFDCYADVKAWAEAAHKNHLHFFPVLNFAAGNESSRFRALTGKQGLCPVDRDYWREIVLTRALQIARIAEAYHIDGILIDPEVYGIDMQYSNHCCDQCLRKFLEELGWDFDPGTIPPERLSEWLEQKGYAQQYYSFLEKEVREIAYRICEEIRNVAPSLMLGFLAYADEWFSNGLAKGWGAPLDPVLLFIESTYTSGYTGDIRRLINRLKENGISAGLVPGIWISKFYPTHIGAHVYHMARESAGYWLFTSSSLYLDPSTLQGDYIILGSQEEYWEAFKTANSEIERLMKLGPDYISELRIVQQPPLIPPSPFGNLDVNELKGLRLVPLNLGDWHGSARRQQTRLRKRHFLYILSEEGSISFTLRTVQVGFYREGTAFVLVAPDGRIVSEGTLGVNEQRKIELANLGHDGVYTLVVDAYLNSCIIDVANRFAVIEASPGRSLWVIYAAGPLYFYVPRDTETFTMNIRTDGPAETASVEVFDHSGRIVHKESVSGRHQIRIDVPEDARGLPWGFRIGKAEKGVLEDVFEIYFSEEIPPYISDAPERLLIPVGGQ